MARDFKHFERDFDRLANDFPVEMRKLMHSIGLEAETMFTDNFRREGFKDTGIEKWKPRKVSDEYGRSRIRYRTNRVGRAGSLNAYGRRIKGRNLLVDTGNLRSSIRYGVRFNQKRVVISAAGYGRYHNEGAGDLPKRQFIGKSKALEVKINNKIDEKIKKWLK